MSRRRRLPHAATVASLTACVCSAALWAWSYSSSERRRVFAWDATSVVNWGEVTAARGEILIVHERELPPPALPPASGDRVRWRFAGFSYNRELLRAPCGMGAAAPPSVGRIVVVPLWFPTAAGATLALASGLRPRRRRRSRTTAPRTATPAPETPPAPPASA